MDHDALVEALEAGRQQRQPLLLRELLDHSWVSWRPCGVSATTRWPGVAAVDGVERGRDHVHAQHHPRAAAVGLVVDLAVGERRVVAVVEQAQLELVAEHGSDRPLLREPGERVRKESEDVELHRNGAREAVRLAGVGEASRDLDSARLQVHLLDARADERQQQARVELEHVVRRAGMDGGDAAERPAALLLDVEAESWNS